MKKKWPQEGYRFEIKKPGVSGRYGPRPHWANGQYTVVSEVMLTVGMKEPWKFVWVKRDHDGKEMPSALHNGEPGKPI